MPGSDVIPVVAATGHDVEYVVLLTALLLVPRVLQRFGIPGAATSLAIGAVAGPGLGLLDGDPVVGLLGTLGIVSLFLLAGLDVDLGLLRGDARRLTQHLVVRAALIGAGAVGAAWAFELDVRAAILTSLALLTPSAGFILDSLPGLGLFLDEERAVRNRVIATELLSLALLLFAAQSTSWERLGVSLAVLAGMVVVLPLAMRGLTTVVSPHAPKSEFAFLVLLAVVCAMVTRELGVYYLVGAFVVGLSARRFRERVPAMSSERMIHAVEAFASVFAPFYFFRAGLTLRPEDFTPGAVALGFAFVLLACGVRVASQIELSRWTSSEGPLAAVRRAVPMLPTLVFTLVLADILRERFDPPPMLVGALVVYALVNTLLPAILMRRLPVPDQGSALPPWPGA